MHAANVRACSTHTSLLVELARSHGQHSWNKRCGALPLSVALARACDKYAQFLQSCVHAQSANLTWSLHERLTNQRIHSCVLQSYAHVQHANLLWGLHDHIAIRIGTIVAPLSVELARSYCHCIETIFAPLTVALAFSYGNHIGTRLTHPATLRGACTTILTTHASIHACCNRTCVLSTPTHFL